MKVVLLGPPEVKRNTIEISSKQSWFCSTSTGDLLREKVVSKDSLGQEISKIMNSGDLVLDNIVIQPYC